MSPTATTSVDIGPQAALGPPARGPSRQPLELPRSSKNAAWLHVLLDKEIGWIPDVSEETVARLRDNGYRRVGDLANADPTAVAALAEVPEMEVQEIGAFLTFVAIPGLERRSARLLVEAGVLDFEQFCGADPVALADRLDELDRRSNGADRLFRYSPLVVERWQIVACEVLGRQPPYVRGEA